MYEQTKKQTEWTCKDAIDHVTAGDSLESVASRMSPEMYKAFCDYYMPDDLSETEKMTLKALRCIIRPLLAPEKTATYQPQPRKTWTQRTGRTSSPDYED
jgi:hypothetical protein